MNTSNLMTATTGASYAKQVNAKFNSNRDVFVALWERYEEMLRDDPSLDLVFKAYAQELKSRWPQYKKFADMYPDMVGLGKGLSSVAGMSVNVTIQRDKDVQWVCEILGKFDPFFINPIRCYYDDIDGNRVLMVWDGQHTGLVLIVIAVYVFGCSLEDAAKFQMPVAIYPGEYVSKIRDRFVGFNDGSMNKTLDKIDLYTQYVYAVRHNGSTNPWHVRMEQIQTALEENNMFFTHEKFGDVNKPGAVSRPSEIFPARIDKFSTSTLANVFRYHSMSNPDKPVEALEIDNLSYIFRACEEQGIIVDNDYIDAMVTAMDKVTGNSWKHRATNKNSKHVKVLRAYNSWRERQGNPDSISSRCNQTQVAPTWICQAIKQAGFKYDVPAFSGIMRYNFTKQELV